MQKAVRKRCHLNRKILTVQSPNAIIVGHCGVHREKDNTKENIVLSLQLGLKLVQVDEHLLFIVVLFAALKVKLMMRRPITQLVAQGIMPREYL